MVNISGFQLYVKKKPFNESVFKTNCSGWPRSNNCTRSYAASRTGRGENFSSTLKLPIWNTSSVIWLTSDYTVSDSLRIVRVGKNLLFCRVCIYNGIVLS